MLRDPWLRALVIVMCAIASIYLVSLVWQVAEQFADILLLFFLAWLLAFVLEPLVNSVATGARTPRIAAIGVTYLALLVLLSVGVVLLVPALTQQVGGLLERLPFYVERVGAVVTDLQMAANQWLLERRSPVYVDVASALVSGELARRAEALGSPLLANVVQLATSVASVLIQLVVVVILSFYFSLDGSRLSEGAILSLPRRWQDEARFLVVSIHRAFAGFLRGQLIQALVSGIGTGLIMAALRVDYPLLGSVVSGVMLLIPFLGPVVAVWLPVTIALFSNTSTTAAWLFVLLVGLQQVVFNVLAPRIMSRQVGLHPLLVFFAVLAGARISGIWGAVFGVPVLAVLASMLSFYRANQEERLTRLQDELPGQELVSVTVVTSQPSGADPSPAQADSAAAAPGSPRHPRQEAHTA